MIESITSLSISERIQLVEDIWDSIAAEPDRLSISTAQIAELDRRLQAYDQNPQRGSTWQELKTKIQNS